MSVIFKDDFIEVEHSDSDPDLCTYHSCLALLDEGYQVQAGFKGVRFLSDGITPICSMLEFFLSVPGVEQANVTMHRVTIRKSPIFSWEEVHKKVLCLWAGTAFVCDYKRVDPNA